MQRTARACRSARSPRQVVSWEGLFGLIIMCAIGNLRHPRQRSRSYENSLDALHRNSFQKSRTASVRCWWCVAAALRARLSIGAFSSHPSRRISCCTGCLRRIRPSGYARSHARPRARAPYTSTRCHCRHRRGLRCQSTTLRRVRGRSPPSALGGSGVSSSATSSGSASTGSHTCSGAQCSSVRRAACGGSVPPRRQQPHRDGVPARKTVLQNRARRRRGMRAMDPGNPT